MLFRSYHHETALLLVKYIEAKGLISLNWCPDATFRKAVLVRLRSLNAPLSEDAEAFSHSEAVKLWTRFIMIYERSAAEPRDLAKLRKAYVPRLNLSKSLLFNWWLDPTFEAPEGQQSNLNMSLRLRPRTQVSRRRAVEANEHACQRLEVERSLDRKSVV